VTEHPALCHFDNPLFFGWLLPPPFPKCCNLTAPVGYLSESTNDQLKDMLTKLFTPWPERLPYSFDLPLALFRPHILFLILFSLTLPVRSLSFLTLIRFPRRSVQNPLFSPFADNDIVPGSYQNYNFSRSITPASSIHILFRSFFPTEGLIFSSTSIFSPPHPVFPPMCIITEDLRNLVSLNPRPPWCTARAPLPRTI